MSETKLAVGDAVTITNEDNGSFTGRVTSFRRSGVVAVVTPDDEALRRWYPDGYTVGSAHWGTVLVTARQEES